VFLRLDQEIASDARAAKLSLRDDGDRAVGVAEHCVQH
jgi:hypothetical protein